MDIVAVVVARTNVSPVANQFHKQTRTKMNATIHSIQSSVRLSGTLNCQAICYNSYNNEKRADAVRAVNM